MCGKSYPITFKTFIIHSALNQESVITKTWIPSLISEIFDKIEAAIAIDIPLPYEISLNLATPFLWDRSKGMRNCYILFGEWKPYSSFILHNISGRKFKFSNSVIILTSSVSNHTPDGLSDF